MTKDEKTIWMFAFRYALNRRTFAMSIVLDELERKIEAFTKGDLEKILAEGKKYVDEIQQQLETAGNREILFSMQIFDDYARLEKMCKKEMDKR